MGVQGFSSYIKKKSPKVGVYVDLLHESSKRKILIGIDGSSFIFHVINQLSRMNSLLLFKEYIESFFRLLKQHSIECCVFVDGYNASDKANEHEKRYIQRSEQYRNSANQAINDKDCSSITHYQFPHPLFSKEFTNILKSDDFKIPIIVSNFEADKDLAQWAFDNSQDSSSSSNTTSPHPLLLGILSNDSDYFFYDMNCYYFPLDQIQFKPIEISPPSLSMIGYTFNNISTSLSIKKSKLSFLAALIGNDQTKHLNANKKVLKFKSQDRVVHIINLVKNQNCSNLSLIKEIYFISSKDLETFNDSMKSYILESYNENNLIYNEKYCKTKLRRSLLILYSNSNNNNQLENSLFSINGHTSRIYNFTKLLYPNEYITHRHCFEPTIQFQNSILNYTKILASYFFGLLNPLDNRKNSNIIEFVTDSDQFIKISYIPNFLSYSYQQCYQSQITFQQRILDFCKIFNSISYYNNSLINSKSITTEIYNFDFFNFYFITSWKFILSNQFNFFKIEEWMIDSFLIHSLLIKNNVKIEFGLHNDNFQPLYIGEFLLITLRWAFDISDAMALPFTVILNNNNNNNQGGGSGGSTKLNLNIFFETLYIHPIWKMAKLNYKPSLDSKSTLVKDRLNTLFKPIFNYITPSIQSEFIYLKNQILN